MIRLQPLDILNKLRFDHPATWLATWGGLGLLKPAPGTWGTLGALPFGFLILYSGGVLSLLLASIVVFVIGVWSARHYEQMVHEKDSSMIVIDEVAGMWVALLPATLSFGAFTVAFLAFRFFDILKPWPIRILDKKFKGPFGVMIDDILAGLMAAFIVLGLRYAGLL